MRQGNERGLELRGRQVDAVFDHAPEVAGERYGVGLRGRRVVAHVIDTEEHSEHRAELVRAGTDAGLADDVPESFGQHAAQIVQAVVCAGGVHELQRFEAGGDRERISRQRTRLIHPTERSQDVHDSSLPADRGQR